MEDTRLKKFMKERLKLKDEEAPKAIWRVMGGSEMKDGGEEHRGRKG